MELKKGMMAISKAGHDQNNWYVVLNVEGEYAFLVNGTTKKMDHPKKKKLKHLQPVLVISEILQDKLQTGKSWTNEEVKRALKLAVQD